MDNLTEKDVYRCLMYLGETDKEIARAKADVEFQKHKVKIVLSESYLEKSNGSVRDREAAGMVSSEYGEAVRIYRDSIYTLELVRARRMQCELTIECWRSINSARSKGIIT